MAKNKGGRPEIYTQELADKLCQELATGKSLRTVCKAKEMPAISTVFTWFRTQTGFTEQYEKAKQEASDALAEEILDIADDGTNDYTEITSEDGHTKRVVNTEYVQRSRLRVDTRKWLMAKMKPKKYGDKMDVTTNGKEFPTPIYGGVAKPKEI